MLSFEENSDSVNASFIEQIVPISSVCCVESNVMFCLATSQQSFLCGFSGRYKLEDRSDKAKGEASKESTTLQAVASQPYREIEVFTYMEGARMFRDMKIIKRASSKSN